LELTTGKNARHSSVPTVLAERIQESSQNKAILLDSSSVQTQRISIFLAYSYSVSLPEEQPVNLDNYNSERTVPPSFSFAFQLSFSRDFPRLESLPPHAYT